MYMANRQMSDLADLTAQELTVKSRELRQQLFTLRLEKATARLEKTHKLRAIRREIARCETRLTAVSLTKPTLAS